jgi:hypothetical protein
MLFVLQLTVLIGFLADLLIILTVLLLQLIVLIVLLVKMGQPANVSA